MAIPPSNSLADFDPIVLQQLVGIDPVLLDLQELDQEDSLEILDALGTQLPREQPPPEQPPPEQTAPRVHAVGRLEFFGWPVRERYLLFNPMSAYWTWDAIAEDPRRIGTLAIMYVFGIVGYALALPFRVAIFIKELFHLPFAFFQNICLEGGHHFSRSMHVRVLCFLGASGELVSGIVGLACPPLAYWIDEKIQDNPIIHAHSEILGLRMDSGQLDSGQLTSDTISDYVPGNLNRVQSKAELFSPLKPYFEKSVQTLSTYYLQDSVEAAYVKTLEQVALIGFLYSFMESLQRDCNSHFLDAMQDYIEAYLPHLNFGTHKETYCKQWDQLLSQGNSPIRLVNFLILRAVQDAVAVAGEMGLEKEDFHDGKQRKIEESLVPVLADVAFCALYDAMRNMSQTLIHADRELLGVIVNESGLRA